VRLIANADWKWLMAGFVLLDAAAVVLGMGLPFFSILLGFPVGWLVTLRARARAEDDRVLPEVFLWAVGVALATFVLMLLVWGRTYPLLSVPDEELAQLGVPLILFEPRASLVGWLVLMVVVSPVLQVLTTVFAAFLTLMVQGWPSANGHSQSSKKRRNRRK